MGFDTANEWPRLCEVAGLAPDPTCATCSVQAAVPPVSSPHRLVSESRRRQELLVKTSALLLSLVVNLTFSHPWSQTDEIRRGGAHARIHSQRGARAPPRVESLLLRMRMRFYTQLSQTTTTTANVRSIRVTS